MSTEENIIRPNQETPVSFSAQELGEAAVLLVDSEPNTRAAIRQALASIGFLRTTEAPNHHQALKKLQERPCSHIIFEAKRTNMPAKEFLLKAFEYDNQLIAIPSSYDPTVDDIFGLLTLGAQGYVAKPVDTASLEEVLLLATKGEPICSSILYAADRNEALASLIMTALDKYAAIHSQARTFKTAARELPYRRMALLRAVDIGRTFAEGHEGGLLEALIEFALQRAEGPASSLGRLRQRLSKRKQMIKELENKDSETPCP